MTEQEWKEKARSQFAEQVSETRFLRSWGVLCTIAGGLTGIFLTCVGIAVYFAGGSPEQAEAAYGTAAGFGVAGTIGVGLWVAGSAALRDAARRFDEREALREREHNA